jgi:type II secretory pathway pseudopilin PulG
MKTAVHPSRDRGFTALELIIVLVIGFSIIALSASKMGELFNASKITRATSSVMELATSVRSLQGDNGYGAVGDITENLIANELVPKTLKTNTTARTIQNEWNGQVTVTVINAGQGFSIVYPYIPKSACAKLATGLLSSGIFTSLGTGTPPDLLPNNTPQDILTRCRPAQGDPNITFTLSVDGAPVAP